MGSRKRSSSVPPELERACRKKPKAGNAVLFEERWKMWENAFHHVCDGCDYRSYRTEAPLESTRSGFEAVEFAYP